MGSFSFYTLGDEFTQLVRNLIKEGSVSNAYDILSDGGLDIHNIRRFFSLAIKFEGDTRKDGLFVVDDTENELIASDYPEYIYWIIKNIMSNEEDNHTLLEILIDKEVTDKKYTKHLDIIFEVYPLDYVISLLKKYILDEEGYYVLNEVPKHFDGVITYDGTIIECGYQQHINLYPILSKLKYSDTGSWTDCDKTFHISSGSLSGTLGFKLQHEVFHENLTDEMLQTLLDNLDNLNFYSAFGDEIGESIIKYVEEVENMGGKFGKLTFLKRFIPNINLPLFSKEEIKGVKNCIRTSPKYSIAGLMNSKFDITPNSIKEIEEDWEKYKKVVGYVEMGIENELRVTNELHYFYQEFLDGDNGVAHYKDGKFTYDFSTEQGDVVQGIKGNKRLSFNYEKELEDITNNLSRIAGSGVQVEFVISDDKVFIVQFRTLTKNNLSRHYTINSDKVLYFGKGFSHGVETVKKEDVLIIDADCDSKELIGKKALIVREDVEFSHILALSIALKIPSIYAVGNVELPNEFKIDTFDKDGYILKIN